MTTRYYLGVAEAGEDGWWISFPAVPGVVSAGETWAELIENARDALLSTFEAMAEDGLSIPADAIADASVAPYDPAHYRDGRAVMIDVAVGETSLQVDLDKHLLSRLDEVATRMNSSRAALLRKGAELLLAANLPS